MQETVVTPTLATKWLARNANNRPMRQALVTTYASDMSNGRWQLNGETIKISAEGDLLDGQHRLAAIVKSGKSIKMLVVSDLPAESFHTIDTGMRRTAAQIVRMSGYSNATTMASAARWVVQIKEHANGGKNKAVTSQSIIDVFNEHPLILHFCSRHHEKGIRTLMPSACCAVMTLAAEKYGQPIVDEFISSFASGEGLKKTDPVYEIRERLIQNSSRVAKLNTETIVAIAIKAVRAFAGSKTVGVLRWSPNEEWPKL